MSWTHYWKRQVKLIYEDFKRALTDCNKVIGLLDISLTGADGNESRLERNIVLEYFPYDLASQCYLVVFCH